MIILTETATNKVKDYVEKNQKYKNLPLRIFINGSNCSGISYGFTFDQKKDDDQFIETNGIDVIIDSETYSIINGSTIDYIKNETGEGFIVNNPNKSEMGCSKGACNSSCSCSH